MILAREDYDDPAVVIEEREFYSVDCGACIFNQSNYRGVPGCTAKAPGYDDILARDCESFISNREAYS